MSDSSGMMASAEAVARRGVMLVLSSPSGAGKSSITRALLAEDPAVALSISATTRAPRPGEVDGIHYHFVDHASFDAMVAAGEMLEYARVFDNAYGTPRAPVAAALAAGKDVLFDVDWQGHQQLAQNARADLVSIFILPPSLTELERRLRQRGQDSDEVIRKRMAKANAEISHYADYDYVITNIDLATSIAHVKAILTAERLRRDRQVTLPAFVAQLATDSV